MMVEASDKRGAALLHTEIVLHFRGRMNVKETVV
jgi:hypothetical protein